jgi:aspartate racemase
MKTLGLIGGTTWVSTLDYYRIINQQVNERLSGLSSAKLFLYSLNFEEFKPPTDPNNWGGVTDTLVDVSKRLEHAGAECIVICANTPHMVADIVEKNISIPLIHIAEATAKEIKNQSMKKIGLLGTRFTMEQSFFRDRLSKQHVATIIPDANDREFIHNSIFNELGKGVFTHETKTQYVRIIDRLIAQGAEGIVLGCTEIPMLIKQEDCAVPIFDTTVIHAKAAVDFALGE